MDAFELPSEVLVRFGHAQFPVQALGHGEERLDVQVAQAEREGNLLLLALPVELPAVVVALTTNEYKTAERLKDDYWLYVVYNCGSAPEVHAIRNPARLGWKPIVKVEHYACPAEGILAAEERPQ